MRRFRLLDSTGTVRGEGVEWSDLCWLSYQLDGDEPRMVNLRQLRLLAEPADAERIMGHRIDWLDPEPADRSRDGDGGFIGGRRVPILTREQGERLSDAGGAGGRGSLRMLAPIDSLRVSGGTGTMRLDGPAPDPSAFQVRDGAPAIVDGVEGHVERTERGLRFVPKERR